MDGARHLVQFPDHEGIAGMQGFEARGQPRPRLLGPGRHVVIEIELLDSGCHQGIVLQIELLFNWLQVLGTAALA